jgi:hypothetical protein
MERPEAAARAAAGGKHSWMTGKDVTLTPFAS